MTASITPSRSFKTCAGDVELGLPDKLAEGAATGSFAAVRRVFATGWAGTLMAI